MRARGQCTGGGGYAHLVDLLATSCSHTSRTAPPDAVGAFADGACCGAGMGALADGPLGLAHGALELGRFGPVLYTFTGPYTVPSRGSFGTVLLSAVPG